MKKAIMLTVLAMSLVALVGCASTVPVAATSNTIGSKTGTASEMYILGIIPPFAATANGGIRAAAKNGGITKISTVDYKIRSFFVVSFADTVVTGE